MDLKYNTEPIRKGELKHNAMYADFQKHPPKAKSNDAHVSN